MEKLQKANKGEKILLIYENMVLLLLRILFLCVSYLGPNLMELLKKPDNIYHVLQKFLQDNFDAQNLSALILDKFVQSNPKWKSHILSILVSFTTLI